MLYIKSMSVDRFKSFKHISVLFNKGFNCIVGPNGSGKSNIIDALFFSLGESSLRRLRVDRLQYLIRESSTRKTQALSTAHVRLELDGDGHIEITRGIRADGKTVYRLNGKRMTRHEVLEVLKRHGVHIDETSTIAQGEINKIIEANAKQRREFIDIAAGIQEFETKKKEALAELEKVATKINTAQAMLNERLTFLNELAKDKEAAEKYLDMSKRLKSLNYSVLASRKKSAQMALGGYAKELAKLESERRKVEEELAGYAASISTLNNERQRITTALSEGTNALDGVNREFAGVSNELSALEVKINTGNSALQQAAGTITALEAEIANTSKTIEENELQLSSLGKELAERESQGKKFGAPSSAVESGKLVKELERQIGKLEHEAAELKEKLSDKQTENSLAHAKKEALLSEVKKISETMADEKASSDMLNQKLKAETAKKEQAEKRARELQERADELREQTSSMESEVLMLKEQRAYAHSRDGALQSKLKAAFGGHQGFFGTVAELCGYDSKYAEAIEAAAGLRFNYLVVDSMQTAGEMIQYLKKQSLGRATFVPLLELSVEQERREKGLQALVDLLDYDKKFEKAFAYIFSNTYLVKDIEEARRLGTGSHRFVTLTGETVERSGVLSGGSRAKVLSIAAIEKKLKELEESRARLFATVKDVDANYFTARKDAAGSDLEIASTRASLDELKKRIKSYEEQSSELGSSLTDLEKTGEKLKLELDDLSNSHSKTVSELAEKKKDLSNAYADSLESASKGMKKEDAERLSRLKQEIEELKIGSARVQQTNKILADTVEQKKGELAEKKKTREATAKAVSDDTKKSRGLAKLRERIETRMKRSSKSNKEALERQDAISKELEGLVAKQATVNSKAAGFEKQQSDIKVKHGQTETRLNDITAEINAYGSVEIEVLEEEAEKMEKESGVLSAKIEALGNVNLKAPEDYEEKARSVNEATVKVNTLEGEKHAVLSMIEEIDAKKLNAFLTTFNEVSKNFSKLYNYIYPGKGRIELEDASSPLETGLSVKIEDPNFMGRSRGLSGGQKSLISLMLLFSIHMCKPSAVYLFDEIDTALDKENSKKLSQLIKSMAKEAQFVVVSHNDSLIVNADAALGVTKSAGDSQVYGIEISNMRKQ